MGEPLSESKVVQALAEQVCERVTRRVIAQLQRLKNGLLSGEDSGLTNAWDEICVQCQGPQSIHWDAYEDTVRQIVEKEVEKLRPYELDAVWLQTDEGMDWKFEDDEPEDVHGTPRKSNPVCLDDVIDYIVGHVLSKASDWENPQIRAYLEQSGGFD